MLILPAHVRRFVEKAHSRGADAVVLDLEDAVPPSEKETARSSVKDGLELAGRGGADVLVRINPEPALQIPDLDASVHEGLHAIFIPKVESPEDVLRVDRRITALEKERGLEPGSVKIAVHVESPIGVLRMQEVAALGGRIESMSMGMDDYRLELGVEASEEASEILFPVALMVTVSKAFGISPLGIVGSVAKIRDLDSFERAAERGRQLGCDGAYCVHPDQVPILNRVFSPAPRSVEHAARVVDAFEAGTRTGRAAINLDGEMVDTPVYKRARLILQRAGAIAEVERRKEAAVARWTSQGSRSPG
jgi:citrate lyase subunit beta / citryl-CoA lyase